jgi:hypothetical protein
MELTGYLARLHSELLAAAAAGDERTQQTAQRLAPALNSATRLLLLDVLAEAAEEITRELAPGSVELRLRGRELQFAVLPAPLESAAAPAAPPLRAEPDDPTARLTLRLPDQLKVAVETAAAAESLSVNAWLVRTVTGALHPAEPGAGGPEWPAGHQQLRGWVR